MSIAEVMKTKTPSFFGEDDPIGKKTGRRKLVDSGLMDSIDQDTGAKYYWDTEKTRVKKVIWAHIDVDGETRALYFSGQRYTALMAALKLKGMTDFVAGDEIDMGFREFGEKKPGKSRAKLYDIEVWQGSAVAEAVAESAPKTEGVSRPDSIPEAVWGSMSADARKAVVASLGEAPF